MVGCPRELRNGLARGTYNTRSETMTLAAKMLRRKLNKGDYKIAVREVKEEILVDPELAPMIHSTKEYLVCVRNRLPANVLRAYDAGEFSEYELATW